LIVCGRILIKRIRPFFWWDEYGFQESGRILSGAGDNGEWVAGQSQLKRSPEWEIPIPDAREKAL
jgi:hypothetical protein